MTGCTEEGPRALEQGAGASSGSIGGGRSPGGFRGARPAGRGVRFCDVAAPQVKAMSKASARVAVGAGVSAGERDEGGEESDAWAHVRESLR